MSSELNSYFLRAFHSNLFATWHLICLKKKKKLVASSLSFAVAAGCVFL